MQALVKIFERLDEKAKALGIVLNKAATIQEIETFERQIGQALPKEIIDFYSFCNGFETTDWIFRIIPINEIEVYKPQGKQPSFTFAEYMIYSDTWYIQLQDDGYIITSPNHNTDNFVILTNSIAEFIERYIDNGGILSENGLYKWLEENKLDNNNFL